LFCGYQAVYDTDFFDATTFASDNGFDYVSFDLNVPRFYIDQLDADALECIRQHAERLGVGLAFHAPGDNVSLFSDYPSIRDGILKHFAAIVNAAERLGARHLTVHTGAYPSFKKANEAEDAFITEYRERFSTVLYDNLSFLADMTHSVLLCVENYGFTGLTMGVVERLLSDSDRVFLTWDIAKTYDASLRLNDRVETFMRAHPARIREVHVHDIIPGFRSHQIVGQGGIDFLRYATIINSPDVAVTFEVRPREAAKVSRDNLIALLRQ